MDIRLHTCFIFLSMVMSAQSYPDGQDIAQSCITLIPGHELPAQTTPPQYKISFSPTSYTPGSFVSVMLSTCSGIGFKGFLIQARRADNSTNQNEAIGNFKVVAKTQQTCPGNVALAHTENSNKLSLSFTWNPPSSPQGHIVFRATFVQDFSIYWVDVVSEVLIDASITTAVNPSTVIAPTLLHASCNVGSVTSSTSSTISNTGGGVSAGVTDNQISQSSAVTKVSACGVTKGCFSNCEGSVCSYLVSWNEEGKYGIYTLTAGVASAAGSYVALGFSSDDQMGGDSVSGCFSRTDGSIDLFNGQTTGEVAPTIFVDTNVTLLNYSNTEGVLSCTFRRLSAPSEDGKRFNISKPWILLFATGSVDLATNSLEYHGRTHRYASAEAFAVSDLKDSVAKDLKSPLVKAHGSLMVGAWIFLASIGIVVARYYKQTWKISVFSQKVWFQIHRTCMIVVLCATVSGFVIIFVEVQGWSELIGSEDFKKAHPVLGVIITTLTVLNPVMALFRPHPDAPRRPIFNWLHWAVGMAAHVLAVITIFFGLLMDKTGVPYYVIYILAAYVAWQLFVMLLLELMTCYGKQKDRKDIYELSSQDGTPKAKFPVIESSWITLVKRILLASHTFIVAGLSIAVIVIIAKA